MRKSTLLLLAIACCAHLPAQWSQISSGTYRHLHDLSFHDASEGWVAADSGLVLHTTDGGQSWQQQQCGTEDIVSIDFLDADTGYALPRFSMPWFTHDGGQTWAQDSSLDGACYGERLRFSGRTLYLSYGGCFGGSWIYTLDPATHDTTQFFQFGPNVLDMAYRDFGFPTPQSAIAMGAADRRAHTSDQGDSWSMHAQQDTAAHWLAVDFVSATHGHAIYPHEFTPLRRTTDGGQTWEVDTTWESTFFYPDVVDLDYRASHFGYIAAKMGWSEAGLMIEIMPGRWMNIQQFDHPARAVEMVTDSLGYAVGDSGMVLKRTGGPLAVAPAAPALGMQLFPNPSKGDAGLRLDGRGPVQLRLATIEGRLLREWTEEASSVTLHAYGLPAGVYVVHATQGGRTAHLKWTLLQR